MDQRSVGLGLCEYFIRGYRLFIVLDRIILGY